MEYLHNIDYYNNFFSVFNAINSNSPWVKTYEFLEGRKKFINA